MIKEDFILLSVPIKFKQIYNELLIRMARLGIDLLQECKSSCKGENQHLISCWNMFNAACAAYAKDPNNKLINVLMKYIVTQLRIDYKDPDLYSIIVGNINVNFADIEFFKNRILTDINNVIDEADAKYIYISTETDEYQEIYQTENVHFIMLPINYVDIVRSSYGDGFFETVLYDQDKSIYSYQEDYVTYNNIEYMVLWNYSPYGEIDKPIKLNLDIL